MIVIFLSNKNFFNFSNKEVLEHIIPMEEDIIINFKIKKFISLYLTPFIYMYSIKWVHFDRVHNQLLK